MPDQDMCEHSECELYKCWCECHWTREDWQRHNADLDRKD